MDYKLVRNQIKSGDVLAWNHRNWKTFYDIKVQFVKFVQQSEYSHVGIAWVHAGRVWTIESVTPYIRIVPLSNLLPCYVTHIGARWTQETEEYALSWVGKGKYSQWEAILAFFGKNNKNDERLECAEFVNRVLTKDGIILEGRDIPSDVVLSAQNLGPTFYIE